MNSLRVSLMALLLGAATLAVSVHAGGQEPAREADAAPARDELPEATASDPPLPEQTDEDEEYGAVAEIEAPPQETTRRVVRGRELTTVAGTRGDALRAIEILPGVGRSPQQDARPVLRGSSPFESLTFIEGVPVPFLFHLGGVTSAFNSRLLERVELYPGNFSARYGRATGGIVEARVRKVRRDRLHALADVSIIDSSALVEAPLGRSPAFARAGRRSPSAFFFENFVPEDAYNVVAAPLYWDYQAILEQELDDDHQARLLIFGSRDRLRLFFSGPNAADPSLRGDVGASFEFHRAQVALKSRLSRELTHELALTVGRSNFEQNFGPFSLNIETDELYLRSELAATPARELELRFGIDGIVEVYEASYYGPYSGAMEGDPGINEPTSTRDKLRGGGNDVLWRPGAYAELRYRPASGVLLVPGIRADYYEQLGDWTLDPRLSTRLSLGPTTTLKGGVGHYSQTAEFYQALAPFGNPDLEPYHALQTSVGIEQRLGDSVELGVEGFYKRLYNRVVGTPGGQSPHFVNAGSGRIYGAELSLTARPDPDTAFHGAYTLSRSERRDLDGRWRLFDQDQTHVLSLAVTRRLGAGWEAGARFRLVSGNPSTPVVGSVYNASRDVYLPIYGAINSDRVPTFHQLDLRIEKSFVVGPGTVAAYLDVQNAYNRQNQEGLSYSYDYSKSEPVTGLPILPNLGIRGEL